MTNRFDSYNADYIPNNREKRIIAKRFKETIVRGTTPTHQFAIPFTFDINVSKVRLTYKQNLSIILEKTEDDIAYIGSEKDRSILYYKLTAEETNLFKPTDANNYVEVQIKIVEPDKDVLVSKVYLMNVLDTLNHEEIKPEPFDEDLYVEATLDDIDNIFNAER